MRKYIMVLVLLATATGFAADEVYSANIVGFIKQTSTNGLRIAGIPFEPSDGTNTVDALFGDTLPVGSKIYTFDGTSYSISTYTSSSGWDSDLMQITYTTNWSLPDMEISAGAGCWVEVPDSSTNSYETVFSGEVETAASVTNTIYEGLNLLSNPYPVSTVLTNFGFAASATVGDKVYVYRDGAYSISTYAASSGWDSDLMKVTYTTNWSIPGLTVEAGEGFWYSAGGEIEWVENCPYEL